MLFQNTGRFIFKLCAILIYLSFVWTVREMIHEAYDPGRQSGSTVQYP